MQYLQTVINNIKCKLMTPGKYKTLPDEIIDHIFDFLPVSLSRLLSKKRNNTFYQSIDHNIAARMLHRMFLPQFMKEYIAKFGTDNINIRLTDTFIKMHEPGIGMFAYKPKKTAEDNAMLVQQFRIGPNCSYLSIYTVYQHYHNYINHDPEFLQLQFNYIRYMFDHRNLDDPIDGSMFRFSVPNPVLELLADHVSENLHSTVTWSIKNKNYDLFQRCLTETNIGRRRNTPYDIDIKELWSDPKFRAMIPKNWTSKPVIENLDLVL